MKEIRPFDLWVARIAAVVGIVYVLLATLWPLAVEAADAADEAPSFPAARDDPGAGGLVKSTADGNLTGVIADIVVTQRNRNPRGWPIEPRDVFPGGTRSAIDPEIRASVSSRDATSDLPLDAYEPATPEPLLATAAVVVAAVLAALALSDCRRLPAVLELG